MDDEDAELEARIAAYAQEQEAAQAAEQPPIEVQEPVDPPTDPVETQEVQAVDPEPDSEDEDQKRRERLYFEKREAQREAKRLAAELEVLRGTRTETRDEAVIREAEALATQKVATQRFNEECIRIGNSLGRELHPVVAAYTKAFPEQGGVPLSLISAAIDAAHGSEHKVLQYLAKNLDRAEEIMAMNPVKQGAEMARIAAKVTAPAITKAPPPIQTVAGSAAAASTARQRDMAEMTTEELIHMWDKEYQRAHGYH